MYFVVDVHPLKDVGLNERDPCVIAYSTKHSESVIRRTGEWLMELVIPCQLNR
jgi:hypothetical protein